MCTNPALLLFLQGLSMRTNYQTQYSQMDMGSSSYFSYNVAALASMTNQQLEVSNELHMPPTPPPPPPCTPPSLPPSFPTALAPHIPQTPLLIVTTV